MILAAITKAMTRLTTIGQIKRQSRAMDNEHQNAEVRQRCSHTMLLSGPTSPPTGPTVPPVIGVGLRHPRQTEMGSGTPKAQQKAKHFKAKIYNNCTWNAPKGAPFTCPPHPVAPGLCVISNHRIHRSNNGCAFRRKCSSSCCRSPPIAAAAHLCGDAAVSPSASPLAGPGRPRSRLSTRRRSVGGLATKTSYVKASSARRRIRRMGF